MSLLWNRLCGASIALSSVIKSFGVILEVDLKFDDHVAAVSKACHFHIWALLHIQVSLPDDVVKMIAFSIISSRHDCCNFLLVGMLETKFSKFHLVQNTLAQVVNGNKAVRPHEEGIIHITPILAKTLTTGQNMSILQTGYTCLQHPSLRIIFILGIVFHWLQTN